MAVPVDPEVLHTVGLAVILIMAAAGLDLFARRPQRHVADRKAVGFRYRREFNAWQCSEGYFLWLRETDHTRRVARYRASAATCNRCAAKRYCTESCDGRELIQPLDYFPHSDEGQLRRGLSLLLLALAATMLFVEAYRHHQDPELLLLAATFAPLIAVSRVTFRHFLKWGRYIPQPER